MTAAPPTSAERTPLIEAVRVGKSFPGVRALDGVSVAVYPGEVLAIVGENGAGKSTLMKILAGVYQPDAGELRRAGVTVRFDGPADALNAGVSLIHQELTDLSRWSKRPGTGCRLSWPSTWPSDLTTRTAWRTQAFATPVPRSAAFARCAAAALITPALTGATGSLRLRTQSIQLVRCNSSPSGLS